MTKNEPESFILDEEPEAQTYLQNDLDKKIIELFPGETVNKRLTKTGLLSSRALPAFVSDWLISKHSKDNRLDTLALQNFLDNFLPEKSKSEEIKHRIMYDYSPVKILADFRVTPDIKTGENFLEIPILDISGKEGIVDPTILNSCPDLLNGGMWGVGELVYNQPEENKKNGKVVLKRFTPFRPYKANIDYYRRSRKEFTDINEWINFLVKAMEYDPRSFDGTTQKIRMISRLLPFVEPRLNLIELAPKGTGKSYVFGRLSKYGWLISGGTVSRAQLFYDISKKRRGIITRFDYVALDEIQSINFGSNPTEVIGALKGYLESGEYSVASYHGEAEAGFVLLGNIPISERGVPTKNSYFDSLPQFMHESAFLDRFHGFIKGWGLPRIKVGSIEKGYALNSEFLSEILHELRKDTTPAAVVEALIDTPSNADQRDVVAIKRIATGFLKLLFPHVRSTSDISSTDFETYCFKPAFKMREIIREQIHRLDEEFTESMPELTVKKENI